MDNFWDWWIKVNIYVGKVKHKKKTLAITYNFLVVSYHVYFENAKK